MGDDLEKFGGWPETYDHCYTDGWADEIFFRARGKCGMAGGGNAGGGGTDARFSGACRPTDGFVHGDDGMGIATKARQRYHALVEEFATRPEALPFLRGGIWRNFFSKYSESNLLQKKMMFVSGKLNGLADRRDKSFLQGRAEARTLLLQAQCNEAYWHGVFGGLYLPHLRTALWNSLVQSETLPTN